MLINKRQLVVKNWVVTVVQKYGLLSTLKTKGKHKHEKKYEKSSLFPLFPIMKYKGYKAVDE